MKFQRIVATGLALVLALVVSSGLAVAAGKPAPSGKVNINTATAQQLTVLPGVGEKLAARIVDYRQKAGGFKNVSELMNVQGIGEKNLAKIQAFLTTSARPPSRRPASSTARGGPAPPPFPAPRGGHERARSHLAGDGLRPRHRPADGVRCSSRGCARTHRRRISWARRRSSAGSFAKPARWRLKQNVNTAIRFENRRARADLQPLRGPANGNGVLSADIATGRDRRVAGPFELSGGAADVRVGINPGVPAIPPDSGTLDPADPIKFGRSNMLSFSPMGTATPGTFYLAGTYAQAAVRVTPGSARVRIMFCRGRRWVERLSEPPAAAAPGGVGQSLRAPARYGVPPRTSLACVSDTSTLPTAHAACSGMPRWWRVSRGPRIPRPSRRRRSS
jgi:competence ComEA-like helix-hairpin-helix protein